MDHKDFVTSLPAGLRAGLTARSDQAGLRHLALHLGAPFFLTQALAPGKFLEICGKLDRARAVTWQFSAEQPLNFNIHFHEGEKVTYPAKVEGASAAAGRLKVVSEQDYCWMWTNKSKEEVKLEMSLRHAQAK